MKHLRPAQKWYAALVMVFLAAACSPAVDEVMLPGLQPDPALTFRVASNHADHELNLYTSNSEYKLYLHDNTDYTLILEAEDPSGIIRIAWDLPTLYFEQHEFESARRFVPMNGLLEKRRIYHGDHFSSIKATWRVTTWKPNIISNDQTPRTVIITVENEDGSATEMHLEVELGAQREGFAHPW